MKKLLHVAYQLGTHAKLNNKKIIIIGVEWRSKERLLGSINYTDAGGNGLGRGVCEVQEVKITGITPQCLAEMTEMCGYTMEIRFYKNKKITINDFSKKESESLEEFCLKVAKTRGYL